MELPIKRIPLSDKPDSIAILEILEGLRGNYSRNPLVWQTALSIVGRTRNNDQMEQVNRLARFVREKMIYVQDPLGGEFVTAPNVLLERIKQQGYGQGDCDDHALLFNSLLGAIGIESRFAGVKLPNQNKWNHVISNFKIGGKWFELDTCSKRGTRVIYNDRLTIK